MAFMQWRSSLAPCREHQQRQNETKTMSKRRGRTRVRCPSAPRAGLPAPPVLVRLRKRSTSLYLGERLSQARQMQAPPRAEHHRSCEGRLVLRWRGPTPVCWVGRGTQRQYVRENVLSRPNVSPFSHDVTPFYSSNVYVVCEEISLLPFLGILFLAPR